MLDDEEIDDHGNGDEDVCNGVCNVFDLLAEAYILAP